MSTAPLSSLRSRLGSLTGTAMRGRLVRDTAGFIARELRAGNGERAPAESSEYRLRESGGVVFLRHGTPDIWAFDQIFRKGVYTPPPVAERLLLGLRGPPRVLDLGANIGLAGVYFLRRFPGATTVAFEPDRLNSAVLRRCASANGGQRSWTIVEACAAPADGALSFESGNFLESRVSDTGGETVPAMDVFPYFDEADLVKMDIQGSEWALLADERFRDLRASVLFLEYHLEMCPYDDPTEGALARLNAAGYEVLSHVREEYGAGEIWACRRSAA